MNKRQKKKFKKKYNCKTYYHMREKRIIKIAESYMNDTDMNRLIYIVDSRRMDLKHPVSVKLFTNIRPAPFINTCDDNYTIDFTSNKIETKGNTDFECRVK